MPQSANLSFTDGRTVGAVPRVPAFPNSAPSLELQEETQSWQAPFQRNSPKIKKSQYPYFLSDYVLKTSASDVSPLSTFVFLMLHQPPNTHTHTPLIFKENVVTILGDNPAFKNRSLRHANHTEFSNRQYFPSSYQAKALNQPKQIC